MVFSPVIARGCTSSLGSWTQWFSLPFPINSAGMTRGSDVRSSSPTSRRASLSSPLGTRVSGEIFTARRCFKPRKWHFRTCHPPATARRCTLSPCSSPWRFSLPPSRSHRVGMEGRHSVDQPHVEVRPAELRSARLRSAELRMPQLRRPELQRQLSRGDGITSVFSWPQSHTSPSCAAPSSGSSGSSGGISSFVLSLSSSRPVSITSSRRPLVPGAHACGSSPHMPRQTMVVSDELPKAPSKESWKK